MRSNHLLTSVDLPTPPHATKLTTCVPSESQASSKVFNSFCRPKSSEPVTGSRFVSTYLSFGRGHFEGGGSGRFRFGSLTISSTLFATCLKASSSLPLKSPEMLLPSRG